MVNVTFPGLGLSFDLNRVAFSIGGFDVYWYGVLLGAALAIGIIYASWRSKQFGIDSDRMMDVIIIGAVTAVIGGRLYYVLCDLDNYKTFADIIDLRSGGIAMYGVLIGAFVGAFIGCKIRKVKVLPMFDIAALGFIMSQPAGRIANFINQEAFGYNTTLPWGMYSSSTSSYLTQHAAELAEKGMIVDPSLPVHPTFLYEAIWTLIGTVILNLYVKKRKFDGEIFLMYLIWYGTGRSIIESLRTDSLYVGSFRTSQLVGVITVLIAATLLIIVRAKQRKNPDYRPVYAGTAECNAFFAVLAAEKSAKKDKKRKKHDDNNLPETEAAANAVPDGDIAELSDSDAPGESPKADDDAAKPDKTENT